MGTSFNCDKKWQQNLLFNAASSGLESESVTLVTIIAQSNHCSITEMVTAGTTPAALLLYLQNFTGIKTNIITNYFYQYKYLIGQ